jgi:hypothetical protein
MTRVGIRTSAALLGRWRRTEFTALQAIKILASIAIAGVLTCGAAGLATATATAAPTVGGGVTAPPLEPPFPPGPPPPGPGFGPPGPGPWGPPPPPPPDGTWNGGWEPDGGFCVFALCV